MTRTAASPGDAATASAPVLSMRGVRARFPIRSAFLRRVVGHVHAVDGVDLDVGPAETVGVVGESGCGKTTLGRMAVGLLRPSQGSVVLEGTDLATMGGDDLRRLRGRMQLVFQDPFSSFDPRATIADSVGEPLRTHLRLDAAARRRRLEELLQDVGLSPAYLQRRPHELSGGQLQRLAIARALALGPSLLVCDEALSSLDVSIRAQMVNLLLDLQHERGHSCVFISHDLSIVRHLSHRIVVLYLGRVCEVGDATVVHDRPRHPYTRALLSAVPIPDPAVERRRRTVALEGELPNPIDPPSGCRFHTRCPEVMDVCRRVEPGPTLCDDGVVVHCHLYEPDRA